MDAGPASPGAHSRTFSFHSDKSGGSKTRDGLRESPRDKQRRDSFWKGGSKANPNAALSEAQPGANAINEQSTLTPLRGIQHKDAYGNAITDPDLSNPTRPRMERPLDTIRSFEKAIDSGYRRRSGYLRAEQQEQGGQSQYNESRRNSSYGYDGGRDANRYSNVNPGGYYGGGPQSPPGPPRRFPAQRMQSEPMMGHPHMRPYGQHGHQFSQDTVNTGMTNGSDSTGPWANSTDPSSENSSIDRVQTAPRQYPEHSANGYGQNGYGPNGYGGGYEGTIPEEGGYPMRGGPAPPVQPPYGNVGAAPARRPIPLGNSKSSNAIDTATYSRPEPEKRKSWLSRRFSRKG